MPVTVRIDPTVGSAQTFVIPNATEHSDGVMTAAMVRQLNGGVPGSGTVTSVTAGAGLTATPNPIVSAGTIELDVTAVTPGSYTNTDLTVDAYGRVTSASNGSAAPSSITLQVYDTATRPAANTVPAGRMIFNTDVNDYNISDGTNWYRNGNVA